MDEPFRDLGWHARAFDQSTAAKPLLRQDEALLERAWGLLIWSASPLGSSQKQAAFIWQEKAREVLVFDRSNDCQGGVFNPLSDDWESRCNLSHKRLLIEVGLRSGICRLVAPVVDHGEGRGSTVSTLITPELAMKQEHDAEHLRLPF